MSTFECPLCEFTLEKHPNADSLSIAKILGYQCVVKTEDFENETLAVYLPLDAIADIDHPLLGFMGGKRVKTCKLRGVVSEGLMLPFSQVSDYMTNTLGASEQSVEKVKVLGKNFAGILRVKRWFDQTVRMGSADEEVPHASFHKYTSIEHLKKYHNVLREGEPVVVTEKLHGTSARFALIDDEVMIGSRGRRLKLNPEGKSPWHYAFKKHDIEDKLLHLREITQNNEGKNVVLFGEIVGPKIQDLNYGHMEPHFYVYDVQIDGHFLSPATAMKYVQMLELDYVPHLYTGLFKKELLDMRLGNSTLDDTHVREGVVIEPCEPRFDPTVGRVILKVISEDYEMRKNPVDIRE